MANAHDEALVSDGGRMGELLALAETSQSRTMGIIFIALGLPVMVLSAIWLVNEVNPSAVALTAAGAMLTLFGVATVTGRKTISVDADEVAYERRLFGFSRRWREPIAAYRGVQCVAENVRRGRVTTLQYVVRLVHPDPKRTVDLASSAEQAGMEKLQQRYVVEMNLPMLVQTAEGLEEVQPEDVGKSVAELTREGKVASGFSESDLLFAPPGVEVLQREGALTLLITRKDPFSFKFAFACLVGGSAAAASFLFWDADWVWFAGGIGAFLLGIGFLVWELICTCVVRVDDEQVQVIHRYALGIGDKPLGPLATSEVQRIYVGNTDTADSAKTDLVGRVVDYVMKPSDAVIVDAGEHKRTFGEGLSPDGLNWLRNCILWRLAR